MDVDLAYRAGFMTAATGIAYSGRPPAIHCSIILIYLYQ